MKGFRRVMWRKPVQEERNEQIAFVNWARLYLPVELRPLLFAIPNGGSRHPMEAINLKRAGVVAGVPDLFFAYSAQRNGLFIEMKNKKGGMVTEQQQSLIAKLRDAGYAVAICAGGKEAQDALLGYLRGDTTAECFSRLK